MKTFFLKLTVIIALSILYGCDKENILNGIIIQELDMGQCFPPFFMEGINEYVINSDSAYQNLLSYQTPACDNYSLPYIDFSKHSLLGIYTTSCDKVKYYEREVVRNDVQMKYVYNIDIHCKSSKNKRATISMNWVLVPALQAGYTVEFNVAED